jgi:hypothetical protein
VQATAPKQSPSHFGVASFSYEPAITLAIRSRYYESGIKRIPALGIRIDVVPAILKTVKLVGSKP